MEPTLRVLAVCVFQGLECGLQFSVGDMFDRFKAYIPAKVEKEKGAVNK